MPYPYPTIVPPEQRLRLAREEVARRIARPRPQGRIVRALARVGRR